MVATEYIRKGHIIRNMKGEVVFTGKCDQGRNVSINAAKRESRKLQGSNLGSGLVRVAS